MTEAHWTPDPIVGWRIWIWPKLRHHQDPHNSLQSMTIRGFKWGREMPPATCDVVWGNQNLGYHDSPHPECQCGYWSLKPHLIGEPFEWRKPIWDVNSVVHHGTIGWVESWGTVWEYEHGYRAERARITALVNLTDEWAETYYNWWVSDDSPRKGLHRQDILDYRDRLRQAAKTYGLPVVEIGDTTEDDVLSSVANG